MMNHLLITEVDLLEIYLQEDHNVQGKFLTKRMLKFSRLAYG